ncbi:MAG: pitrilysin family protein [Burkholderiales bacterium]
MRNDLWRLLCAAAAFALLAGANPALALPTIQQWTTPTGARVYFVENHDLPIVDVSVDFPAGSSFDARSKSGAAGLTQYMLRFGADGLDEDQISNRIADVGAQLSGRFDLDRAGLGVRTLSSAREQDAAIAVLAKVLQSPTFPQESVVREKNRIVADLKEANTKPETIAAKTFFATLYGEHPYALPAAGSPETVAGLTREDLVDFYRAHYNAPRAVVAIMGDVTRGEADAIARRLTDGLPPAPADAVRLPDVTPLARASEQRIAHPATQSHILMGAPGIRRNDPDYFALIVGNYVLGGGGFVSRFTEEVRSRRGLAYSVYSTFQPLRFEGPFQIGLQTKKEQSAEALDVVRVTLRDFIAKGPTEQELRAAKQNIVGGFPLRVDSNRKIHEYIATIGFYDLPLDYLDRFPGNVERVSVEDVKRAFADRVHPDALATVVVGAPETRTTAARP